MIFQGFLYVYVYTGISPQAGYLTWIGSEILNYLDNFTVSFCDFVLCLSPLGVTNRIKIWKKSFSGLSSYLLLVPAAYFSWCSSPSFQTTKFCCLWAENWVPYSFCIFLLGVRTHSQSSHICLVFLQTPSLHIPCWVCFIHNAVDWKCFRFQRYLHFQIF